MTNNAKTIENSANHPQKEMQNSPNNMGNSAKQHQIDKDVESEIVEKQPVNLHEDSNTDVSDYFEEVVMPKKLAPASDAVVPEDTESSFSDFEIFNGTSPVQDTEDIPSTEIEVYQEVESGESDVLHSTGELAKMFNVSNQTIRNTADFFVEILSDERGATGQKLYNSEDIAIIEKIFYMTNVQKYKRRDIRDQFIKNGISAKKGSNISQNLDFDNLPKAGPPVATADENTELIQEKMSQALTLLQKNMMKQVNDGLMSLENNIRMALSKDINDSTVCIGDKISQTKSELLDTIVKQSEIIKEQHDQIIRLKSTIININKAVLKIESSVSGMSEGGLTKEDIAAITGSIDEVIKSCSTAEVQKDMTKLREDTQNTAKQVHDEIAKQHKTLARLEDTVNKIDQNIPKDDGDRKNTIKAEVADTLNRNYQKIEKVIKENSESQLESIDTKLIEISKVLQQENNKIDEKEVDELNNKLAEAIDSIDRLAKANADLETKNMISENIIGKQSATIEDLKKKIKQNTANASQTDKPEVANKLLISQKLIEKLSKENEDLKTKGRIKDLIISKQDVQLKQFQGNPQNEVFDAHGVQNNVKETSKTNTEAKTSETLINTGNDQGSLDLLSDE